MNPGTALTYLEGHSTDFTCQSEFTGLREHYSACGTGGALSSLLNKMLYKVGAWSLKDIHLPSREDLVKYAFELHNRKRKIQSAGISGHPQHQFSP